MTECNQGSFQFEEHFSKQVVARFDGGRQTSDAGGLLLRETDRRLKLLSRLQDVSSMAGMYPGLSIESKRWWRSGYTDWRWVTKI